MSAAASQNPPGRQVVVVREGPSKRRPIIVDAIVGILGFALLFGSVALVDVLPEDPVIEAQYKAVFERGLGGPNVIIDADTGDTVEVGSSGAKYATEGSEVTWRFEFPDINIYEISLGLVFRDDRKATLPDQFTVELEAPNGTITEYPFAQGYAETIPTIPRDKAGELGGGTVSQDFWIDDPDAPNTQLTFRVGSVPSDYFFTEENLAGETLDRELFEVQRLLQEQEYDEETAGVWTLRVRLLDAGDCPEPDPQGLDVQRATECRIQSQNEADGEFDPLNPQPTQNAEQDLGNPVQLAGVSYVHYDVTAQET